MFGFLAGEKKKKKQVGQRVLARTSRSGDAYYPRDRRPTFDGWACRACLVYLIEHCGGVRTLHDLDTAARFGCRSTVTLHAAPSNSAADRHEPRRPSGRRARLRLLAGLPRHPRHAFHYTNMVEHDEADSHG